MNQEASSFSITAIIKELDKFSLAQNTGFDYLKAVLIFIGLFILFRIFRRIILSRLKKLTQRTKTDIDDFVVDSLYKIGSFFYFMLSLYFGMRSLKLPAGFQVTIKVILVVIIAFEFIRSLERLIEFLIKKYMDKATIPEESKAQHKSMANTVAIVIRFFLWVLGITLVLSNLGVDVTSILASLGIGGIAIALATQNILSDIFCSFSIYIDKPFKVGDFIVVGNDLGNVEKIGLKSTRIRTLHGEELIISNKVLTDARVQNYQRMLKRQVLYNLGVVYNTESEKLEKIPVILKEIIQKHSEAEFDRCHFKEFGNFSLNFEVGFYVNSRDYKLYLDLRHQINLETCRRFKEENIEFAYPTQTLFVNKSTV